MDETTRQSTNHNHRNKLRKGLRVATSALVLSNVGGALAGRASAEKPDSAAIGFTPIGKVAAKEINPSKLAGKSEVSDQTMETLRDSTVKIVAQDAEGPIDQECTGVKVDIGGTDYVLTSAHCFSQLTNSYNGRIDVPGVNAFNYFSQAELKDIQYSVVDPDMEPNSPTSIGAVTAISIDTQDTDLALLQIDSVSFQTQSQMDAAGKGGPVYTGRTYDEISAIDIYSSSSKRTLELQPGDQVALYGLPQTSDNVGVASVGDYLGKVGFPGPDGEKPYEMYIVGLNAPNADEDSCEFGASGSGALTEQGYLLPGLSIRNDPGSVYDEKIQEERDLADFSQYHTVKEEKAMLLSMRNGWAEQLGVDLSGFTTICGYSVPDNNTYKGLVAGFDNPVPAGGK